MQDLIDRRVPQYLAVYLGVAWGIVQFISFLEERYGLSPHWTNFTLLAFALLIPAVVLFVYNHGRPGKDEWTRAEKVGIPLNLMVAAAVMFLVFSQKDLGAVMTSVTTRDETGKRVEREVPRASYRQRLALFNFDAPAADTALAWLRYALPLGVSIDLGQDMFIDVRISVYFREKLRQLGFKDEVNVPLALKRKIAEEQHLPYFTDGNLGRTGDQITVDLGLHETSTGKLLERKTFQSSDVFSLIDQVSAGLKESLEIPTTDKVQDLPVSNVLTSSLPAFRSCAEGLVALQIRDQWQQAAQGMEKAVQLDPTFALAWISLHNILLLTGQSQKSLPPLQKALDHVYHLPERMQYDVKAEYYAVMKQDVEKARAVAQMKVDLYPEDISAYGLLAQMQLMLDDKQGRIASFQKMLELDPGQHELLRALGSLYEAQGDFENALRYYTQYAERFPSKQEAFLSIGALQQLQGKHAQARANFDKALVMAPEHVGALLKLGKLERDLGNFDAAQRQYRDALQAAKTPDARSSVLESLGNYYEVRGQLSESLRFSEQMLQEASKVQPRMVTAMMQLGTLDRYVRAGRVQDARRTLERVSADLQAPYNTLVSVGELKLALELEQPDAAERAAAGVEQAIKALGFKLLQPMVVSARGQIAELRGQCEPAVVQYEAKQKSEPTNVAAHVDIGRCYRKLRQPKKAIQHLEQALVVVPFQPDANYEIGLALLDDGNRTKALEHLQRAATVWSDADPAYKKAAAAKAKLKEVAGS